MPYRPPVFNLTCHVWHNGLAGSPLVGTVFTPTRPPDLSPTCQLYFPRYGSGGDFAIDASHISITLRRAGYMALRLPAGTDVRAPWGAPLAADWDDLDLIEVPAGSGRLYVATMVDEAHKGFPNEYRIAVIAQISEAAAERSLALGLALEIQVTPPVGGGGGGGPGVAGFPSLALGLALDTEVTPPVGGLVAAENLAIGLALDTAFTTNVGASVTPATSCGSAPAITLTYTDTQSIGAGGNHWWKFAGISGTTYHIQVTLVSGSGASGFLNTGACGSQTVRASVTPPGVTRASFTLTGNQDVWVHVTGGMGAATYALDVGTGV